MLSEEQNSDRSRLPLGVLEKHWVLISSVGGFLFISLKVAAVSGFNFTTATALVTSGFVQVLMGTLFTLVGIVPLYIGLALLTLAILNDEGEMESETEAAIFGIGAVIAIVGFMIFRPWSGAVTTVLLWFYYLSQILPPPRSGRFALSDIDSASIPAPRNSYRDHEPGTFAGHQADSLTGSTRNNELREQGRGIAVRLISRLSTSIAKMLKWTGSLLEGISTSVVDFVRQWGVLLIIMIGIFFVVFSPSSWLVAERITTTEQMVVGYVVAQEGDWTTILTHHDRRILRIRSDSISARQVCELGSGQSLLQHLYYVFSGTASYPACAG